MALTPEDVVNKRFQATKFREGYDQDEVDDFLDEVVNELRRLTEESEELRTKLGTCEQRVGELSRSTAAQDAVEVREPATVTAKASGAASAAAPAAAPTAAASQTEAAAGMLALAQRLHDEYVKNGEQQRDKMIEEAREHSTRLKHEADEKQQQTLGVLEQERVLLERKIDELRGFERDYRSRMKAYLEGQLRDLEAAKAIVLPGRPQPTASVTAVPSEAAPARGNSKG
jgi:DivIVA domain-containing protein